MMDSDIREQLQKLHIEHQELDAVIARLVENISMDHLQLQRLKKKKLYLKDTIARLESKLIPDYLA
ncbi:MAG: DUF465 domain-containing protein [Gammaproteobacteria bacterium]|nr:DUF465 domain-containing protein [Gammaproteobacteria bacterium]